MLESTEWLQGVPNGVAEGSCCILCLATLSVISLAFLLYIDACTTCLHSSCPCFCFNLLLAGERFSRPKAGKLVDPRVSLVYASRKVMPFSCG